MKRTLNIALMLILVTLVAANASAQSKMTDEQKKEFLAKFQANKEELKLTNDQSKKVFEYWEPGGGAGLRILFNKKSRSALCIDFGRGRNGASGLFLGLNEVF